MRPSDRRALVLVVLQKTHSGITIWGTEWEGEYSLSHGTNFSAVVAILFRPGLEITVSDTVEMEKG